MSYTTPYFTQFINPSDIKCIFEVGSRDLLDAFQLYEKFKCKIFSFECNPDCLNECRKNLLSASDEIKQNLTLVDKAVCIENGPVTFFPFDLSKYDNMGSSSLLKIDFSKRDKTDPDYNKPNPQKEVTVEGTRLDTFLEKENIEKIDLICMDLQGYELNALKSLGERLKNTKYIITECSIINTYEGGASFSELNNYLSSFGFTYVFSDKYGFNIPYLDPTQAGFCEFNSVFINTNSQ